MLVHQSECTRELSSESWQFVGTSQQSETAYLHRLVNKRPDGLKSPSHCGVEYIRMLNQHL